MILRSTAKTRLLKFFQRWLYSSVARVVRDPWEEQNASEEQNAYFGHYCFKSAAVCAKTKIMYSEHNMQLL